MTQFNEEKGYVEIRTIKIFEFQNTRRDFKKKKEDHNGYH